MKNFYAPGLRLMQNSPIRRKLGLMGALLLVPLLMFMVTVAQTAQDDITFVKEELWGTSLAKPMSDVLLELQVNRGLILEALSGDDRLDKERDQSRQKLKELVSNLNTQLDQRKSSRVASSFNTINSQLNQILSGRLPDSKAEAEALYDAPIHGLQTALITVGEESGLLLDPVASTYFLMDLSIERLATWAEHVSVLRSISSEVALEQHANAEHNALLKERVADAILAQSAMQVRIEALQRAGQEAPATWESTSKVAQKLMTLAHTLATKGLPDATPAMLRSQVDDAHGAIGRMTAETFSELNRQLENRLFNLWIELVAKTLLCLVGLGLVAYLNTCFYADFFSRIEAVQATLRAVSKGNLSRRLNLSGQDELVKVGQHIDEMSENLSLLVSEVRSSAVRVGQAGLSVSDDGKALSRHTEEQASSLRQSVMTVGELSGAVSSNAEAAVALEQLTANLKHQAEAGASAMDETVSSIHSLQESARRIGEINNVINDIAFQTNLLALNASVEAARAGESGRGFAVVASEVRQLAQRCAEAAAEVHDVIEHTTELVDLSVDRIGEVNSTLSLVVRGVGDVSLKLKSIASASEQQSMGLQAVTATVGSLDDLTHQNANLVDRSTHSSKTLVNQAEALRKSVAHIQLRQGTADEAQALVERAVARIAEVGWSRACADFNKPNGEYVDRDLYLFGLNRDGVYVVMSKHPEWVGRSMEDIAVIPTDVGTQFMELANERSKFGNGWVEYDGPTSDNPEGLRKTAYIASVDEDTFLGCGVLRQATKSSNKALGDQAISVMAA